MGQSDLKARLKSRRENCQLHKIMKREGYSSPRQLAEASGFSQSSLENWIYGGVVPNVINAMELAKFLNTTLWEVYPCED